MSPSNADAVAHSTYTREQMKQVLEDALSPLPPRSSPLSHKHSHPLRAFESIYRSPTSSSSSSDSSSDHSDESSIDPRKRASERTPLMSGRTDLANTAALAANASLVRPSPRFMHGTPATRTFEVEASFLQAMIGLLERQANIVPDHMLTKSEIRRIVRKEMDKRGEAKETNPTKSLSGLVTPSRVLALTAGVAGLVVLQRARMRYPEEMAWFLDGAWKGGLGGFVGAMVVKGVLWGFGEMGNLRGEDWTAWQA